MFRYELTDGPPFGFKTQRGQGFEDRGVMDATPRQTSMGAHDGMNLPVGLSGYDRDCANCTVSFFAVPVTFLPQRGKSRGEHEGFISTTRIDVAQQLGWVQNITGVDTVQRVGRLVGIPPGAGAAEQPAGCAVVSGLDFDRVSRPELTRFVPRFVDLAVENTDDASFP